MFTSKFIEAGQSDDDRLVAVIYEDSIQSFARDNYERELTDVELNRVTQAFWNDSATWWETQEAVARAIEYALDEDCNWKDMDEHFMNSNKLSYRLKLKLRGLWARFGRFMAGV